MKPTIIKILRDNFPQKITRQCGMAVFLCLLFLGLPKTNSVSLAQESNMPQSQEMRISIYQRGPALMTDLRELQNQQIPKELVFENISPALLPDSIILKTAKEDRILPILDQIFRPEKLSSTILLRHFLGQKILINDNDKLREARVLSTGNKGIFEIDGKIHTDVKGEKIFPFLPSGIQIHPSLIVRLKEALPEFRQLSLSYLTQGLTWRVNYTIDFTPSTRSLNLVGNAEVKNQTGMEIKNARIFLISGEVKRISRHRSFPTLTSRMEEASTIEDPHPLGDGLYHIYPVTKPVSLHPLDTIQIPLITKANLPAEQQFVLTNQAITFNARQGHKRKTHASIYIRLPHDKENSLDIPLPAGTFRAYAKDQKGTTHLIGETRLRSHSGQEDITLKLGQAIDVSAVYTQTDFISLGKKTSESEHQVQIQNTHDTPVTVYIREPFPAWWKILQESFPHRRSEDSYVEWTLNIPANESKTLTYRILTRNKNAPAPR